MPQPGRIPLPDGEPPVDIVYQAKGEPPTPAPAPDILPGNEPAVGRVQPQQPNPEVVAGAEVQAPAAEPVAVDLPGSTPGFVPNTEVYGIVEDPPTTAVVGGDLPQATVTVERPDGTVQDMGPGQVRYTPTQPVGSCTISQDGVWIGGDAIPMGQVVEPPRIEHDDCEGEYQTVTMTFMVKGVNYATTEDEFGHAFPVDSPPVPVEIVPHHESAAGCTCQLNAATATVVAMFNNTKNHLRRFVLQRDRDDTGVSGTGVVAEGVLLTDGRVVLRWLGERSSIVMWNDLANVMTVHGHNGATRLRWLDMPSPAAPPHPDAGAAAQRAVQAAQR